MSTMVLIVLLWAVTAEAVMYDNLVKPQEEKHLQDVCNGGTKNQPEERQTVLWFCYNGSVDVTIAIPLTALKRPSGEWPRSADEWDAAIWYITTTYADWGQVIATNDKTWDQDSYGWGYPSGKKIYSDLEYTYSHISFRMDTTEYKLEPHSENSNCTVFQICAYAYKTDPCWGIGFCKVPTNSNPTNKGVIVAAPSDDEAKRVYILKRSRPIFQVQPIFHHPAGVNPQQNTWYNALLMILGAGQINESCYACTLFPKSIDESILVKPIPLTQSELQCLLCSMTNLNSKQNARDQRYNNWLTTNATYCSNCKLYNDLPVRANLSEKYSKNQELMRPIMSVSGEQVPKSHPVCFERKPSSRHPGVSLGDTSGCEITITATCGSVYNLTKCNVTGRPDLIQLWGKLVYGPSDDGGLSTTMTMWQCDRHLYQILPPFWEGRCAMVFLTPTITVHSKLQHTTHHYPHYRQRRETGLMTSVGGKFLSGLLPGWGAVNNAHNLDKIHVQLESLTAITQNGFSALGPFAAAVRSTLAQHQMALDILLASQGGLCHVIGEKCCTYIPDIEGNITATVLHLNDLLTRMKDDDVAPDAGWSLWGWLTSGRWQEKLFGLIAPVLIILFLLCCCSMCVVPLISRMLSGMMTSHVQTYMALRQGGPEEYPEEDPEEDPEEELDREELGRRWARVQEGLRYIQEGPPLALPNLFPDPEDYDG